MCAILLDWFRGDDEPACDLTDREMDEAIALERELDDLERQAEDELSRAHDESECL